MSCLQDLGPSWPVTPLAPHIDGIVHPCIEVQDGPGVRLFLAGGAGSKLEQA